MSTPSESDPERPCTYVVLDQANREELDRVKIQDQMLTIGMGGPLPEQEHPELLHSVLDIGCGTGNWLIEVAKRYSMVTRLAGIDANERMVAYARAQAMQEQVSDRTEFYVMNALHMVDFPAASFDLLNQRLGASYLRTWDWPALLDEYQRVLRPGGIVRITEGDMIVDSNSPALRRLQELMLEAAYHAGNFFANKSDGVTSRLTFVLRQNGFLDVQAHAFTLVYRAGTLQGQRYFEDMKLAFRTIVPYLRKWTQLPADYEQLYQQALVEMQQPGFVATWNLLTVWGENPLHD